MAPQVYTKSGLMAGLGETDAEVQQVMDDLRAVDCDILTLGQYLQPSPKHLPVANFITPAQFNAWREVGEAKGFSAGCFVPPYPKFIPCRKRCAV